MPCHTRIHALRSTAIAAIMVAGSVLTAGAQTISPLVSEYASRGRGRLELLNSSDRPLNVVVEAKGFSVDENGEVRDEPLPPDVKLKLSAMSLRIPAHQTRYVFYDATAGRKPAWFVLYAVFSGYPRADFSGLTVQLELPHFVYLLPSERWTTGDIGVTDVAFDRATGKLELTLENHGSQFGRIEEVDVKRSSKKISVPGFPLFPQGRRKVALDWDGEETPDAVAIKARDFSFERKLTLKP